MTKDAKLAILAVMVLLFGMDVAGHFSWLAEKYPLKAVPRLLTVTFLLDYHEALADTEIEDVEDGARRHYRESRFFPHVPANLRESIQAVIHRKARLSMAADVGKPPDEPDDPEELRRYYQDTLDGMRRMGLDMTGWYIDDSGERPRLVTGRSEEG